MSPVRIVTAPPLVLEPLLATHAPEMFTVLTDPAIYEFENAPPGSEEALTRRYAMLERRQSPNGEELWLNWVIRLPSGALAGYVQATVLKSGSAYVAYELSSRYWRRGIGSAAVAAMLTELRLAYAVRRYVAVLKARNYRSLALLRKLGFVPATEEQAMELHVEPDEVAMIKRADH